MARKKGVSDVQISILLEHSRMNREKSLLVLDKSLLMYFSFIFVGVVGFVGGYLDSKFLNIMVVLSFGVLAVGIVPYIITMHKEEQRLNSMIEGMKHRGVK
jgi:preprotein translocase subunit Sss1